MPWTEDQLRAIEARGKNLLVAAAAGSGKTSVLVERVIRLVTEGVNVDDILVVTFTRAASADMREKLTKRFMEMASSGDSRAREQMERLESANISTLHSFCTDILRKNFEQAGIDPMFRILDDAEYKQLSDRAMDEALENAYLAGGEVMEALDFARGPERVRRLAFDLHNYLMERPDGEAWFANALSLMDGDGSVWTDAILKAAKERLREAIALNEYGIQEALLPLGPSNYADAMREDGEVLSEMLSLDYDNLSLALSGFKQLTPKRASRKKGEERSEQEQELANEVSDIRDRVKAVCKKAAKLMSLSAAESVKDIRQDRPLIEKLYEIAQDMEARLKELKLARCAVTFSDLEHLTLRVLSDDSVSSGIRDSFKYVFVDEYQDTSDVQEAIIQRISGTGNLFMVGDVKQSIYRFRQAEPKLFLQKYEEYGRGGDNERIVLKKNFRSRDSVLTFVNHIFARVMHGGVSEIDYDDNQMLYKGASFDGPDTPVEMHIINKKGEGAEKDEDEADEAEELTDAEREGFLIADRIHRLMKEDPSLSYRDICVITRVRVNALEHLASALSASGIPAYADASESYFDALEVMQVISALRLIVNRRRDIDLISVMRSPMFSFTTSDLASIRACVNASSFYDALQMIRETDMRVDAFFETLARWRALSRSMPISRLIRKILSDTGFYTTVGALAGGRQRQANIDQFCVRAKAYEQHIGGSLSEFLEYALQMKAKGDGDSAHILGENDDVVRLMTSHKSKGLEFPVVFASLLSRRFRESRSEDQLNASRDMGCAILHVDRTLESRRDTVSRRAIETVKSMEDRAEELRIFYVTLTRAKSRLILTGTVRDLKEAKTRWKIAAGHPDLYKNALDIAAAAVMDCPGAEAIGSEAKAGVPQVNVFIHAPSDIGKREMDEDNANARAIEIVNNAETGADFDETMNLALLWKYKYESRIYAPVKLTVSNLARETTGAFEIPKTIERPAFLSGSGLTATERGSAVHAFLRHLDYRALNPEDMRASLQNQLDQMLKSGKIHFSQTDAIFIGDIAHFLLSPVGRRLMNAKEIRREWRFNLRMPADEAEVGFDHDAEVIVQGSIDLCFLESGEWVLVDYKTDRYQADDEIAERYRPQLRLYAHALERITGKRVKEAVIAMISRGRQMLVGVS